MERKLLFCVYFTTFVYMSNGCTMEGITQWLVPQHGTIQDTHRGVILTRSTENIADITRIDFGDSLNRGPYLDVLLQDSMFAVSTTDAFSEYEEHETLLSIRVAITFRCTDGTPRSLIFVFNINDTNNHAPVFIPNDNYNFPLALPVPPGFNVTGCEYLIVRDVDLTTKSIEFWMEENPYFEILFSQQIQPKEFGGIIRTKDLIRSTSESLTYIISATDVDDTLDPPITTNATVNILADNQFRLPDQPIFSEAFYKADYTEDHDLILREYIRLREGYDDQVKFNFEGVYVDYFEMVVDGNQLSFRVKAPLPGGISEPQIFLVIKAEREFTSGATATLIIILAQGVDIVFESPLYEGHIEDNVLRAPNLIITQGFDDIEEIKIISDYASYFSANRQENTIILSMSPLPTDVIQANNILNLQILASTNRTSAISVVTLEIIKDDYVTPAFEKTIYNGNYDPEIGLSIDPIVLLQGYDDTVVFTLRGEHERYFEKEQQGSVINLRASIPAQIWSEGTLLIAVEASKPRTVGGNTAVYVTLPAARELSFEAPSYSGSIENNILTLENIVLSTGYAEDVIFELSGQFATYFAKIVAQNHITISLQNDLPENVISDNNALILMLTASGLNALTTSTSILLDIVKEDTNTPVFDKLLYHGSYDPSTGLILQDIIVNQGLDYTVNFTLDGGSAELFQLTRTGQNINLNGSVPPNVWNEGYLFLTLRATKPRTVGANTAIQISLPEAREMNFGAMQYFGTIENNTLIMQEIILRDGYSEDVTFQISGEFRDYFIVSKDENKVFIKLNEPLPDNVVLENNFIVLNIRASGLNAISTSTTVFLEIVKEDTNTPIFSQDVFRGIYINSSYIVIENISLVQGYDSEVVFQLSGDHAQYFEFNNIANNVFISLKSQIPEELIFEEKVLLFKIFALKKRTVGASAIISIQFPRDLTEPTVMRFSKNMYLGTLKDATFEIADKIILDTGFRTETQFTLSGEFAEQFSITNVDNVLKVSLHSSASVEELYNNKFIILQIEAHRDRAISVYASLVIDVVTPDVVTFPVFEKPFYSGIYTKDDGLQFEQEIRLLAGFDDTVTFGLEGDSSKWFSLKENGNSVLIVRNISEEIPHDIIELNHQLLFTIFAYKPGTLGGRSAISIALPKNQTEQVVLRFQENNYVGSIEDGALYLAPLSLNKDTATVQIDITGEYAANFGVTKNQTEIMIKLTENLNIISVENSFIILNIEAFHVGAISGHTTVVLEIKDIKYSEATPVFEEAFYLGDYTEESGLRFNHTIRLIQGFDDSVSFSLEGDESHGFILRQDAPNNVILLRSSETLQVDNRSQLTFSIIATKPQSTPGRSAIIIFLTQFSTAPSPRFSEDYHQGSITNGVLNLGVITLVKGYSEHVKFSLTGDYVDYFQFTSVDGAIILRLTEDLPSEIKEKYNILILVLEAQVANERTHTTIVIEIKETAVVPDTVLNFEETYYTGSYSEIEGLIFNSKIIVQHGYSDQIEFNLNGDDSIWFGLERRLDNSVALTLTSPIPAAVLANNRKLIFVVVATQPGSIAARAAIIIALTGEYTLETILGFEQISYSGSIINSTLNLEPIVLSEGFTSQVSFTLFGDFASFFRINADGAIVKINLHTSIPDDFIPSNGIILLDLRASAPQSVPAFSTIALAVKHEENISEVDQLFFSQIYYTGSYTDQTGLSFEQLFSLAHGYDDSVVFELQGDNSVWFGLETRSKNSVALVLTSPIPAEVLANNQKLIFVVTATRPDSGAATATIVIALPDEYSIDSILGFERISYTGSITNSNLTLEPVVLNEGFSSEVSFGLFGDHTTYFTLIVDGPTVTITLREAIPEDSVPINRIILLELRASAPQAVPAFATLVITIDDEYNILPAEQPSFAETYYTGRYTEQDGLSFQQLFSLAHGYDESILFALEGDSSIWFGLQIQSTNQVALTLTSPIPAAVLANNQKLIFVITATRPDSETARATVVIALPDEYITNAILGFEQITYTGSIRDSNLTLKPIFLNEGYNLQVSFSLYGDHVSYFTFTADGPTVTISLRNAIPEDSVQTNRLVLLELRASAPQAVPAFTTIVLTVEREDISPPEQLSFAETYYTGHYTEQDGLSFQQVISLARGYDDSVVFKLEGDSSVWFGLETLSANRAALTLTSPIPAAVLENNQKLIFVIIAIRPGGDSTRATVVIALPLYSGSDTNVAFDRVLYNGFIILGTVRHEPITISKYNGSRIELYGQHAELFEATLSETSVVVTLRSLTVLPDVSNIALELHAGAARAVLALEIVESENPVLPTVTFDSPLYVLRVDITQTGIVGRVRATSDNGERISYSLIMNDVNLIERLSINNYGELWLSAPASSGAHFMQVVATTAMTRATANATIHLTVEAVTVCGDNIVVPPLIVLDRDEEEPHRDLVVLNRTTFEGCLFSMSNMWPEDQSWLYVDNYGLHAKAIDREHQSIAFMALSQIQVELILICNSDTTSRNKRSLSSYSRGDWLGPYDYGANNWILTDSIPYNARRSLVNLIVNDINDNAPIFVGKENEPIAVGYPVPNLEEIILPRSLAELKATDADIGENAALVYWSSEESLAVAPTTGFIHVRNHFNLENNSRLIVQATDRNGDGLSGNLELVVKLLEKDHIAVLTIQDAFLDGEEQILSELSKAVGYEIKTLRTIVISESSQSRNWRNMSEGSGASLQLFVYGLIEREPVEVNQLIADITNSNIVTVNVARSISLEDHLEGNEICVLPGRDTGLLVATIVLSILLFILIVAIAAWFLKRQINKNYDRFIDRNSLTSQDATLEQPKTENPKPRLNIEDLRRSERRLQERLEVPIVNVSDEAADENPLEAIINISAPEPNLPIVIQTIDKLKDNTEESEDDDEFGERKKSRRKSVVTFNENVEKIIHLEDTSDISPDSNYEIYKL